VAPPPKIAVAAPYGLGGVPEGTASSIFRSPCESVRACMTAATIGTSAGPRIRNRAPVVNCTSITPGDIGNAVIGAKGVAGAVGCGTSFCSRSCAIMTSAVWRPDARCHDLALCQAHRAQRLHAQLSASAAVPEVFVVKLTHPLSRFAPVLARSGRLCVYFAVALVLSN